MLPLVTIELKASFFIEFVFWVTLKDLFTLKSIISGQMDHLVDSKTSDEPGHGLRLLDFSVLNDFFSEFMVYLDIDLKSYGTFGIVKSVLLLSTFISTSNHLILFTYVCLTDRVTINSSYDQIK